MSYGQQDDPHVAEIKRKLAEHKAYEERKRKQLEAELKAAWERSNKATGGTGK